MGNRDTRETGLTALREEGGGVGEEEARLIPNLGAALPKAEDTLLSKNFLWSGVMPSLPYLVGVGVTTSLVSHFDTIVATRNSKGDPNCGPTRESGDMCCARVDRGVGPPLP